MGSGSSLKHRSRAYPSSPVDLMAEIPEQSAEALRSKNCVGGFLLGDRPDPINPTTQHSKLHKAVLQTHEESINPAQTALHPALPATA